MVKVKQQVESEIYNSIIDDVIKQVHDSFLDECVDIGILNELKETWQSKIRESRALGNESNGEKSIPSSTLPVPMLPSNVSEQTQTSSFSKGNCQQGKSHVVTNIHQGKQQQYFVCPLSGTKSKYSIMMQQPSLPDHGHEYPNSSTAQSHTTGKDGAQSTTNTIQNDHDFGESHTKMEKNLSNDIIQLDGGPGMSDSSSEEEQHQEEDTNAVSKEFVDQEDSTAEGEPLNSDDSLSEEDDVGTIFTTDNTVLCEFEKIHHVRKNWKFMFNHGLMHIEGRDYCFRQLEGDAEW